jgi:hypothetical protein
VRDCAGPIPPAAQRGVFSLSNPSPRVIFSALLQTDAKKFLLQADATKFLL